MRNLAREPATRVCPNHLTLPPGVAEPRAKYSIKGHPVTVLAERLEYLDENGRLVTESLRDYSRRAIRDHFASPEQFLRRWPTAATTRTRDWRSCATAIARPSLRGCNGAPEPRTRSA
jgi:type I site-specific restriction endonuclease